MKKISIIILLSALAITGCRKKTKDVSQEVKASVPTVTVSGSQFYSIHVGDALPDVSATAYDSTIGESYTATVDKSTLDNSTPGLYIIKATAKNKYGYVGSSNVYVAVTDISDAIDLSGLYDRSGFPANVEKVARGLYFNDNIAGSSLVVPGYFAQLDETTLDVPVQSIEGVGNLYATDATVDMTGDTTFSYAVVNGFFGGQLRTFVKQH